MWGRMHSEAVDIEEEEEIYEESADEDYSS